MSECFSVQSPMFMETKGVALSQALWNYLEMLLNKAQILKSHELGPSALLRQVLSNQIDLTNFGFDL